jgi:hypothetical protein
VQPPFLPAVTRVVAGRNGVLWLQRENIDGARRWSLIDSTGLHVGDATLPPDARVLYGDRLSIYTTETDSGHVAWVVKYRVSGS